MELPITSERQLDWFRQQLKTPEPIRPLAWQATDEEIIDMIRSDDRPAFTSLFQRYYKDLKKFTASIIEEKHAADADDIIQEIFMWIWTNRKSLPVVSDVRGYLFGAVKNKARNQFRSFLIRRNYTRVLANEEANLVQPDFESESPATLVNILSNQLPKRCKQAFDLSRTHGDTIQAISRKMQISPRVVENHITRALQFLRPRLEHLYPILKRQSSTKIRPAMSLYDRVVSILSDLKHLSQDVLRVIGNSIRNTQRSTEQIFVRTPQGTLLGIHTNDILCIRADRAYCDLVTDTGLIKLSTSMNRVYKKLDQLLFVQSSRSTIVNVQRISAVASNYISVGQYRAELGRQYKAEVLNRLNVIR